MTSIEFLLVIFVFLTLGVAGVLPFHSHIVYLIIDINGVKKYNINFIMSATADNATRNA